MRLHFDEEKFVNAVLFFAKNSDEESFGITKLNKMLYYSDFEHFKKFGRPIIGDRYVKMKRGPVPSISYNIVNALLNGGIDGTPLPKRLAEKISVKKGKFGGKTIHRIEALDEPDMSVFSRSELDILREVVEVCKKRNLTATFLSKLSHKDGSPWSKVGNNQEIDFELVLDNTKDSISKEYIEFRTKEEEELAELVG